MLHLLEVSCACLITKEGFGRFFIRCCLVSHIISPCVKWNCPGAISFDGQIVNSSDYFEESLDSPVWAPTVSSEPIFGAILFSVTDERNIMGDRLITSSVDEYSACVVIKSLGDCHSADNGSSLLYFVHHFFLTANSSVLRNWVNFCVRLCPAALSRRAILAFNLSRTPKPICPSQGLVDAAGFICDIIFVNIFEGGYRITSGTPLVTLLTGEKNLRRDIDVRPFCISCNLYSVGERWCGCEGPARSAVVRDVLISGHC